MENPIKHYLRLVIKVNIKSDKPHYCNSIYFDMNDENDTLFLVIILPKTYNPSLIIRKRQIPVEGHGTK